jgi:hypothetical protein
MKRRSVLMSLAMLMALPLSGCWGDGTVVKRIKVIAKAEVDGKIVEGSSVTELKWRPRGDGGMDSDGQGEAVVLELAGKGTVYVLSTVLYDEGDITSGFWYSQVGRALGIKGAHNKEDLPRIVALKGRYSFFDMGHGADLPLIVAFKDENDFRSVYRVLPSEFDKRFGNGVKFLGGEFEVTEEPVTSGAVAKRLPILLQPAKEIPNSINRDSNGNLINQKKLPFEYKIGTMDFFDKERF